MIQEKFLKLGAFKNQQNLQCNNFTRQLFSIHKADIEKFLEKHNLQFQPQTFKQINVENGKLFKIKAKGLSDNKIYWVSFFEDCSEEGKKSTRLMGVVSGMFEEDEII